MDHAGAVIGPVAAFLLLSADVPLNQVFYWSAVPGLCVLALIAFGVPRDAPRTFASRPPALRWRALDRHVRAMVIAGGGLALAAVPEVFVVLWARDSGLEIVWVPLLWAAASLAKMLIAMPAGMLSDRVGRKTVLVSGWSSRVVFLLAIALADVQGTTVWILFVLYSMSLAFTEPAERSIIGDHARIEQRGTAYGFYHLTSGLLILPGTVLFGTIWERWNSSTAFIAAACVTVAAAFAMHTMTSRR
jgi:MFS family permease